MAAKPKAGTKAVKGKNAGKSQATRFKQAARRIGADESGKAFESAFHKIIPSRAKV